MTQQFRERFHSGEAPSLPCVRPGRVGTPARIVDRHAPGHPGGMPANAQREWPCEGRSRRVQPDSLWGVADYSSRDIRSRSLPDFLETTVATVVKPALR